MKIYEGMRTPSGVVVTVFERKGYGGKYDLPPRRDLRNHSPDGFEWGYSGSGPAQLALALCCDVLGDDERAMRVYQRVKELLIAPQGVNHWTLTEEAIRDAISHFEPQEGGFALVDLLAFILAALLLVLCSAPVYAPLIDDAPACTTDSQCAELCRPDDDECDGGPQR